MDRWAAFFIEASTRTAIEACTGPLPVVSIEEHGPPPTVLSRDTDRRRLCLKSVQTHHANRRTVMADCSSTAGIHLIVE
jgi:hypothetical protein